MLTDVARLDLTEAKAFEIRRWAVGLRDQIQEITDPDTLAELSALLVGARVRLRQLKDEVVEAERTHVAVVRRLGELMGPATNRPSTDETGALPKKLRTTARAFADYPAIVEDGMRRERVSVSAIYRRIADQRGREHLAETADRVSRDVTSLSVQPGQIWVLGDHRLYCGMASEDPFVAILRDVQPSLSYVDIPRASPAPDMLWLSQYADLMAVATEVDDMARVMSRVDKPYRWTLQFIHNTPEPVAVGQSHCWPLMLFADVTVPLDLTTDYHRIRDDISTLTDGRKPITLTMRILEALSKPDEVVVDPFAGVHGLTLMASEKLGRRCVTAEPDPLNCANIIARFNRDDSHPL